MNIEKSHLRNTESKIDLFNGNKIDIKCGLAGNALVNNNSHDVNVFENELTQKQKQKYLDRLLLESTGRCLAEPNFDHNGNMVFLSPSVHRGSTTKFVTIEQSDRKHDASQSNASSELLGELFKPRVCYVCKTKFTHVHHFYHQLCFTCASENYKRRSQIANLTGRVALVTGGRIKIGFEVVLKLLRLGAKVIVTSRFKYDALARYQAQEDYEEWKSQLVIYGLDLKHIPSVEKFADYLCEKYSSLDILINNAAQTIRKPESYYQAMTVKEEMAITHSDTQLLGGFEDLKLRQERREYLKLRGCSLPAKKQDVTKLDEFDEPVDMSTHNSWLKTLEDVDTLEFLEAQTINATAPFILNSRLKFLMSKSKSPETFIVNVSAMEGQFNRKNKTYRHPHTNMAKAALNMMTRTSARDYARDGIYMTSVDTGWVTQENPFPVKIQNRAKGMVPPLDCIDGASRVLAPILDGCSGLSHESGVFLKDYRVAEW